MKKTLTVLVTAFILFIYNLTLNIDNCLCQWQSDSRLTNAPDSSRTSYNNARCIASSANVVHTVWIDKRDGNNELYYKQSTDGGEIWGADIRLTNDPAFSLMPSVSASGSNIHIVWYDSRDGNYEIYYKRSTDGGVSWGADTRLTNDPSNSRYPSLSVSGSMVHVVWYDNRDGNNEIYYKRSTDGGVSWGVDTRLTNDPSDYSYGPSVAISGTDVHVVWYDYRDGRYDIYYKRSTDDGVNWGIDTRLTNPTTGLATYPSISVSGQYLHVVWQDNRDGNYEIYYKCSTDGGISWAPDLRLTNNPGTSFQASVLVSGSKVHVAFNDSRDGNNEIYYKHSSNKGVSWDADTRLTNNSLQSAYPSLSVSGLVVHVVWMDNRDGNFEIYYKRNPNGNLVGINNINSETPEAFKLMQNYPNPFNPSTKFNFDISKQGFVSLKIFDALGREVEILVNQKMSVGSYSVDFNGAKLSSGVYFCRMQSSEFTDVKKFILLK